jgi:subtilase family serine protease
MRASRKMPRMSLHFSMTPAQQADLAQLLIAQQDRRSPQYHQFLTPEQYAARFGPKTADLAPIVAWLEEKGLATFG